MDPQTIGFLKDEYLKLQDQYEDYDRRSLTIKGWVSAGAAVAVVAGFKQDAPFMGLQWLVIATFAGCFWYLEARWKQFQYALAGRIMELEGYFRGEISDLKPLQMYATWFANYRRARGSGGLWLAARQDFVMLPYAIIILFCIAGQALSL